MAKGDIKAGKSPLIGATGEYFVMAELLRRGWLAGLTPRGAKSYDIIATMGDRTIKVRVKTKTADANIFRWNLRDDGTVFMGPTGKYDICVLVDLAPVAPDYYVIQTARVEKKLLELRQEWLDEKSTRKASNRVIAFVMPKDSHWLDGYKSWAVIDAIVPPDPEGKKQSGAA